MSDAQHIRFAFFGTSHIAVYVLDELEKAAFLPELVVTLPTKPRGRGLMPQPTAAETWATERNIEILKPESFDAEFSSKLKTKNYQLCIIVDYGKIVPRKVLSIPKYGFLNVHPSLLPRLRGPSPMRSAILHDERETGVTVMLVDEHMDHGPIVAQKKVDIAGWSASDSPQRDGPLKNSELEKILVPEGGRLLARILPEYIAGNIEPRAQNHDLATYSEKFSKDDGLLDLKGDSYKNLLKIRAFEGWPGTYAFFERNGKRMRVQILDADLENGKLVIKAVKPEGKRAMPYGDFIRSGAHSFS
jgi:methionyl-tRNA formyltransferase